MKQEKFSEDEFAVECLKRGFVGRGNKTRVRQWCKKYPKEYYTVADMIEVYRYFNERNIGDFGQYDGVNHVKDHYDSLLCNATAEDRDQWWFRNWEGNEK